MGLVFGKSLLCLLQFVTSTLEQSVVSVSMHI